MERETFDTTAQIERRANPHQRILAQLTMDIINAIGKRGASREFIYQVLHLKHGVTADQFNALMDALVSSGRLHRDVRFTIETK